MNLFGLRPAALVAAALTLSTLFLTGCCVSRETYYKDIGKLETELNFERRVNAEQVKNYEQKLHDKSNSLKVITERYMELEKSNGAARGTLDSLQDDLQGMLNDMAELKMVIYHNVKGSEGAQMLIKLNEMKYKIKRLMKNGAAKKQ